ncbi:sigma-54 interaction domain-containing protein [Solimonas soli]|uniref:sigma-54 interaction domain-containing protein n=1 Tax=Solimonas soli TaxID=413479 RepID=UPI0004B38895|nr:sigma-54 dependent transcriptional regulator [Solimonas soli]
MPRARGLSSKILFVADGGELPSSAVIWAAQRGWMHDVLRPAELAGATARFAQMPLAVVCDDGLDDATIADIAQIWRQATRGAPLILAAACGSEARVVAALRAGYGDYLSTQASAEEWRACLQRHLQPDAAPAVGAAPLIIGDSPAMRALKLQLPRIAASDCTALIIGETGTGKERVAEQIHRLGPRRDARLVAINCAALPDSLLESELFGYEKGAFTGAVGSYCGKLMLAEGGTLFLDEIGDMSAQGQAKLLRALESREFYRLGARHSTRFDVRIVAATNQPLERLVERGEFRKDLYYRLNVARIDLPPLRERRDDIAPLLRHYLRELGARLQVRAEFDDGLVERLIGYDWPGNIRELKNVIEAALICASDGHVALAHLPSALQHKLGASPPPASEREFLLATLQRLNWNKSRAAESLHWSRMTLYRKLAKYAISAPDEIDVALCAEADAAYRGDSAVTAGVTLP